MSCQQCSAIRCRNGTADLVGYPAAMPKSEQPEDDQPEPIAGRVTTLFGQPVIVGPAHHVQSITPIATVSSQPIRKRHTKGWWKRRPADD